MESKGIKAITALLFNAVMGVMVAAVMGVPAMAGAATAVSVSLVAGPFLPSGALCEGVLTEVWTGELIKTLRAGDVATFLDGLPDYSQYAENDVIHMIDVGGDPEVLVNNTTYPLTVQDITDTDAVFSLDKFQTKPTPVTDDELYASSYDKMSSLKERHADAIKEKKFAKAIHALAPDSDSAKTPVLKTSGEVVGGGTTGRKRLQISDIIALKDKFDKMKIPVQGRRLVLCSDHVNDLLLTDQNLKISIIIILPVKLPTCTDSRCTSIRTIRFTRQPEQRLHSERQQVLMNIRLQLPSIPNACLKQRAAQRCITRRQKQTRLTSEAL